VVIGVTYDYLTSFMLPVVSSLLYQSVHIVAKV
jgi:hypothetical protein